MVDGLYDRLFFHKKEAVFYFLGTFFAPKDL